MRQSAADPAVVDQLADALVANYKGMLQLFCKECWIETRVGIELESCIDQVARSKAARQVYASGWRWIDGPRCPKCVKALEKRLE